mmetsp:Transcript_19216/g.34805  ORF Transcript_19216/g.34805 Transcript_19216/m.34805 type:complete len:111 (+) Transcript_19216:344-676(+)
MASIAPQVAVVDGTFLGLAFATMVHVSAATRLSPNRCEYVSGFCGQERIPSETAGHGGVSAAAPALAQFQEAEQQEQHWQAKHRHHSGLRPCWRRPPREPSHGECVAGWD